MTRVCPAESQISLKPKRLPTMNSSLPSVLTRGRRRLVVLLIAIALTALALALILSSTTARGASIYGIHPQPRRDPFALGRGIGSNSAMAFDSDGNLFITNPAKSESRGKISKITRAGAAQHLLQRCITGRPGGSCHRP